MYKLILEGNLFLAPIGENPQRILDLGCGTGSWAVEIGVLQFIRLQVSICKSFGVLSVDSYR